MKNIEIRKRTWEEKCAFMEGYEECAKFADSYLSEEGENKIEIHHQNGEYCTSNGE